MIATPPRLQRAHHLLTQAVRHAWGVTGLRREDVWLASWPRSGNSWFRAIMANLIALREREGEAVDWVTLRDILPVLGPSNLQAPWPYRSLPRFVKTHQPYRRVLFARPRRTVYLVRDPRDAAVSYYNLAVHSEGLRFAGTMSDFLRHPRFGLRASMRHHRSWATHTTVLVRYEELRADTPRVVGEVLAALGEATPDDLVREAVSRAAIERMREKEKESGLRGPDRFKAGFRAVRSGASGQWRDHFSDEDLALYADLCRQEPYGLYAP